MFYQSDIVVGGTLCKGTLHKSQSSTFQWVYFTNNWKKCWISALTIGLPVICICIYVLLRDACIIKCNYAKTKTKSSTSKTITTQKKCMGEDENAWIQDLVQKDTNMGQTNDRRSPAGPASWWYPAAVWPGWLQPGWRPPQRPVSSRKREPGHISASGF